MEKIHSENPLLYITSEIYSWGDPSMYVYYLFCYRLIVAP